MGSMAASGTQGREIAPLQRAAQFSRASEHQLRIPAQMLPSLPSTYLRYLQGVSATEEHQDSPVTRVGAAGSHGEATGEIDMHEFRTQCLQKAHSTNMHGRDWWDTRKPTGWSKADGHY